MSAFLTLFKHERRTLFPSAELRRKPDVIGGLLSLILTLGVVAVFALLIAAVAESYVAIKIDKVSDPTARSIELLNALYTVIILALGVFSLEKMRTSLTAGKDKQIFLRLPVSQGTIFRAKLAALLLWNYVTALFLVIPVNLIFYYILSPGVDFLLNTLIVYLLLPMASFLISTVLLVPYIRLIDFLSSRYFLTFILLSGVLIGAFLLYSKLLSVLQGLFETGSIKFLFSESFVNFLCTLASFTYPANCLACIALGENMKESLLISAAVALMAMIATFFVTRRLYRITMYKNNEKKVRRGRKHVRSRSVLGTLMHKEFVTVFREPKYVFSYFAVAMSMPFMVYCCYTLFETLIYNAVGLSFNLSLSIIVILILSILTNTFCATNITRDGVSALKSKIFPVKPKKILLSKVLFCDVVSSLSVIASALVLHLAAGLKLTDTLIAIVIGLIFSLSQIFIATRMDLNHARPAASTREAQKASNRTIAKTITLGLIFAMVIGFLSLFISVFAGDTTVDFLGNIVIKESYSYIVPLVISVLYLIIGRLYYSIGINRAFEKLVR